MQASYEQEPKLIKGGYVKDHKVTTIGVTNRDTRSLDFGSYRDQEVMEFCVEVSWAVVSGLSL